MRVATALAGSLIAVGVAGYLFSQRREGPVLRYHEVARPERLDAWQIIGPGGGGTFYNPTISPFDPNLVLVSSDMTDSFITENGGRTWREFNLRTTSRFYFDRNLKDRIYATAGAAGSFYSDDRGHTWKLFHPEPSSVNAYWYNDDEAEPSLTFTDFDGTVRVAPGIGAFAVDPDDSGVIYWVAADKLYTSHDLGKHSKELETVGPVRLLIVDPASPRNRRTIYVVTGAGVGIWDGKNYRAPEAAENSGYYEVSYGFPAGGGAPVIYESRDYTLNAGTVTGGGIVASRDGGRTWKSVSLSLLDLVEKGTAPEFKAVATSREHPEVIYASYFHLNLPGDAKRYFGVAKSADGGGHWALVWREADAGAPNVHDSWTTQRFGPDYGEQPLNMTVDDRNPDIIYTTDLARTMKSIDGGKNWEALYSQGDEKGYATTGLDPTTCYGLHFDPFDAQHMFISYTDTGLFKSYDGGKSWLSATVHGVPQPWVNTTYWMEFDPAVKGRVWAVMSANHDLPRWRTINSRGMTANFHGGVVMSTDGGETWNVSNQGMPEMAATHILLDPRSPPDARVLYVTGMGRGVFKSQDGGKTWVAKNTGLTGNEPMAWRLAMDSKGTLYLVTVRISRDGKFGNDRDGWLYRSNNGGDSWERLTLPAGLNGPMGITVDPDDPARLYLSAWGRLNDGNKWLEQGGVYLSTDAGVTWNPVLNASRRIYDVTVDPKQHNLLYAAGFEAAIYRSSDRGNTWWHIQGFNFKDAHRVIPDPLDSSKIYVTTFGSSVWHGPAQGDPKAVEDIVSPPVMQFGTPPGTKPKARPK